MTGVERILAAAGLQPVDRPPVAPVLLMQGAKELGLPLSAYFGEPDRLAEGQLALLKRYDADAVFAVPHIVQDTLPWGAGIDIHEDGPPSVNRMVLDRYEELDNIRVPVAADHPYLRHSLDAARALAAAVKGERLIVGAVIGPFSLPSMLMGTGKFLSLLVEHQDAYGEQYGKLIDAMVEYSSTWAKALVEAGCDLIVFAEGVASEAILTEDLFLRFAKPVLERFVAATGGILALEFVGPCEKFLPHVTDLGVAAFLVGEREELGGARRAIGPARALMGNLNNLKLLRWTPERVEFEARRAIHEAGPGFILSNQGPEIPWETPDKNIEALVRAVRR
jgi:uroporphyrinogen decarboxylase